MDHADKITSNFVHFENLILPLKGLFFPFNYWIYLKGLIVCLKCLILNLKCLIAILEGLIDDLMNILNKEIVPKSITRKYNNFILDFFITELIIDTLFRITKLHFLSLMIDKIRPNLIRLIKKVLLLNTQNGWLIRMKNTVDWVTNMICTQQTTLRV